MAEVTIKIDGMSCQHCVMRVKRAIDNLSGVLHSDVQIGAASVAFDESRLKKEDIIAAVEKAGYKIVHGS